MSKTHYVALLRGINVGGNNIIKMTDLKACLEAKGFENVATYIQSGNVLFEAKETKHPLLLKKLNAALTAEFGYDAPIMLRSYAQMAEIMERAPKGFGEEPTKYKYDVVFLKEPATPDEVMKAIRIKEGVDAVATGPDVLYLSRLISKLTQSRLNRIASIPAYQHMTARNWNTSTKLFALMKGRAE